MNFNNKTIHTHIQVFIITKQLKHTDIIAYTYTCTQQFNSPLTKLNQNL